MDGPSPKNSLHKGAQVTLVTGPTHIRTQKPGITTVPVESASEMFEAASKSFETADIEIFFCGGC